LGGIPKLRWIDCPPMGSRSPPAAAWPQRSPSIEQPVPSRSCGALAPGAEPTHAIPPRERIVLAAVNVDSDGGHEVLGKVIGASKLETVCPGSSRWLTSGGLRSTELVIPHVNAEAVQNHLDGQAKMAKTSH